MSDGPRVGLEERYGAPSRSRRLLLVLGAGAVAAAFLGWLAWAMWFHSDPAVSSELIGFDVVDDHTATAVLRVEYGDGPVDAECSLRAVAEDKTVVGQVSFSPDPDEGPDYEVEIATERRATTVERLGCTTEGQPRPR